MGKSGSPRGKQSKSSIISSKGSSRKSQRSGGRPPRTYDRFGRRLASCALCPAKSDEASPFLDARPDDEFNGCRPWRHLKKRKVCSPDEGVMEVLDPDGTVCSPCSATFRISGLKKLYGTAKKYLEWAGQDPKRHHSFLDKVKAYIDHVNSERSAPNGNSRKLSVLKKSLQKVVSNHISGRRLTAPKKVFIELSVYQRDYVDTGKARPPNKEDIVEEFIEEYNDYKEGVIVLKEGEKLGHHEISQFNEHSHKLVTTKDDGSVILSKNQLQEKFDRERKEMKTYKPIMSMDDMLKTATEAVASSDDEEQAASDDEASCDSDTQDLSDAVDSSSDPDDMCRGSKPPKASAKSSGAIQKAASAKRDGRSAVLAVPRSSELPSSAASSTKVGVTAVATLQEFPSTLPEKLRRRGRPKKEVAVADTSCADEKFKVQWGIDYRALLRDVSALCQTLKSHNHNLTTEHQDFRKACLTLVKASNDLSKRHKVLQTKLEKRQETNKWQWQRWH